MRMKLLGLAVPPNVHEAIREESTKQKRSMSSLVSEIIVTYLVNEKDYSKMELEAMPPRRRLYHRKKLLVKS